jgi:hypothetical protein
MRAVEGLFEMAPCRLCMLTGTPQPKAKWPQTSGMANMKPTWRCDGVLTLRQDEIIYHVMNDTAK